MEIDGNLQYATNLAAYLWPESGRGTLFDLRLCIFFGIVPNSNGTVTEYHSLRSVLIS